jgi:peptidoglycan/xylan/chitin deacetylase (PgdA/CDA1 family)
VSRRATQNVHSAQAGGARSPCAALKLAALSCAAVLALTLVTEPGASAARAAPVAAGASGRPAASVVGVCVRDTASDVRWTGYLYTRFLHRNGSLFELGSWMPAFTNGIPYQGIAYAIADSIEAITPQVAPLYHQLLDRSPSDADIRYWVPLVQRHSPTWLAAQLLGSAEAYARAGSTNAGWIDATYRSVFGRPADPGGLAYWNQQLISGTSRAVVARQLWDAPEHLGPRIDAAYQAVLGRHADPGGAHYWAPAARTFGDVALGSLLASTQEAWNLAQTTYGAPAGPMPPACPPPPLRWVPPPGTVVHDLSALASHGPRLVALTFDDGPNPTWTPQVLDILDHYDVPATFFLVGHEVQAYPDLVRAEVARGHHVAVHTMTHQDLLTLGYSAQYHQIVDDANLIDGLVGAGSVKCFRPPYGNYDQQVVNIAANRGLATVLWSRDGRDWARPGVSTIVNGNLDTRYDGGRGVIILHDGGGDRSQTVAALPILIQDLRAQGYQFVQIC